MAERAETWQDEGVRLIHSQPPGAKHTTRYELIAMLGDGAFAETWVAREQGTRHKVTVKRGREDRLGDDAVTAHFRHEDLIGTGLGRHPGLVPPASFEAGSPTTVPFLIFPYIEAESLDRVLSGKARLADRRAVAIAARVLETLEHAHQKRIMHLDVQTANILVTDDATTYLIDWGVARTIDADRWCHQRPDPPSLEYAAPELLVPGRRVGASADVFAVGMVLYEMLTGRRWPKGQDAARTPERMAEAGVPATLAPILARALATAPADRPTAGELAVMLGEWVNPPTQVMDPSTRPGAPDRSARARWWAVGAVLVLVVAVLGFGQLVGGPREPAAAGQPAVVIRSPLNVRAAPGLDGEVVASVGLDERVIVTGQPVEADDYLWYPVTVEREGESVAGYAWVDCIDLLAEGDKDPGVVASEDG